MQNTALLPRTPPPGWSQVFDRCRVADCYQCGKCTAGCPVADRMEDAPNKLIRLVQLGHAEAAARSAAIWECLSCQTCSARCPKSVDCAGVMDALREAALARNCVPPESLPIILFQKEFLENIRRNGRLGELELIGRFKAGVAIRTGRLAFLLKDARLAPQLSKRKKLHFISEKAGDRAVVQRIFARCSKPSEP